MAYTFGAGTGDDINITAVGSMGGDNGSVFVAGWWYPTTLTATRGYWSAGNTFGAEVDTTTSEIRLRTDNTTDGQWVTSGAGITVDKWWFIAFLAALENTTVAGDWRVWVGDAETPPQIITPTVAVSRSGNYVGSTAWTIGNKGTGTLAFQGDIGWVTMALSSNVGVLNWSHIATSGVIAATEAEMVERRLVTPLWAGRGPDVHEWSPAAMSNQIGVVHFPLDQQGAPAMQMSGSTSPANPVSLTINGATWTENRPPRCVPRNWLECRMRVLP